MRYLNMHVERRGCWHNWAWVRAGYQRTVARVASQDKISTRGSIMFRISRVGGSMMSEGTHYSAAGSLDELLARVLPLVDRWTEK